MKKMAICNMCFAVVVVTVGCALLRTEEDIAPAGVDVDRETSAVRATLERYLTATVTGDAQMLVKCYTGSAEDMRIIKAGSEIATAMKMFRDRYVDAFGTAAWKVFCERSRKEAHVDWNFGSTTDEDMILVKEILHGIKITINDNEALVEGDGVLVTTKLRKVRSSWLIDAAAATPPGEVRKQWLEQIRQMSTVLHQITESIVKDKVSSDQILDQLKEKVQTVK